MKSSIDKMYEDLLSNHDTTPKDDIDFASLGALFTDPESALYDEDDTDIFITSKEIVKTKEKLESKLGITDDDREVEETVHFKRYSKRKEHKYTEKEMEAIKESCRYTVVHDYSDKEFFHMSDEERAETDMLADIRVKLGTLKRTYSKVDQYIEAMRIVVQAWELLEKKGNFLHTEEEFFKMVADKRIICNGLLMPKLKRIDRYNIDLIIRYISDTDLDPKDLIQQDVYKSNNILEDGDCFVDLDEIRQDPKIDDWYFEYVEVFIEEWNKDPKNEDNQWEDLDDEQRDLELCFVQDKAIGYIRGKLELEKSQRLLSPEQAENLYKEISDPNEIRVKPLKRSWVKDYERRLRKHKGNKNHRHMTSLVHDMLNRIQDNPKNTPSNETASYSITQSMFDIDKEKKDFWDDLFFDGSWQDNDATFLYDLVIAEELMKLHPPKENYATYADRALKEFFRTLEESGINVLELKRRMNYTDDKLNREEKKRSRKENAKMEAIIMQRIEKLNNSDKFKKLIAKAEKKINDNIS